MKQIRKKDKLSITVKVITSVCLLIAGAILNFKYYTRWGSLTGSLCTTWGFLILFFTLSDLQYILKKGKLPVRDDERSKMITGKSSTNAFVVMIVMLPVLATFFTSSGMVDVNLFAAILIIIGVSVFITSVIYYNR